MVEETQRNEVLARRLWAVGDPVRLRILELLPVSADCDHGNNVSRLAEVLGLSQPSVSHHLRILRQAELVANRKMCRDVFYWKDPSALAELAEAMCALAKKQPGEGGERNEVGA